MRDVKIEQIEVGAYQVPTDGPEADGTLAWDSTTMVLVTARAGGQWGLGYSYTDASAAQLIETKRAGRGCQRIVTAGGVAGDDRRGPQPRPPGARGERDRGGRHSALGLEGAPPGPAAGEPARRLPGCGSSVWQRRLHLLSDRAAGGTARRLGRAGHTPRQDEGRQRAGCRFEWVRAARAAIGPAAGLFVDANGAYDRKQALGFAEKFAAYDVSWFEEPVSSDDLAGLRLLRDRAPPGMDITAGEYGYDLHTFRRMLEAGAVDVLQPDATRCLGVTGFMQAAALCRCFGLPLSAHTAPSLQVHLCCAAETARHLEYFHDHVRIEEMLLDGAPAPQDGALAPDLSRPGLGLELRAVEAERYAI